MGHMACVYIVALSDLFKTYFANITQKNVHWNSTLIFYVEQKLPHVDVQQFLHCTWGKRKFFLSVEKLLKWKSNVKQINASDTTKQVLTKRNGYRKINGKETITRWKDFEIFMIYLWYL